MVGMSSQGLSALTSYRRVSRMSQTTPKNMQEARKLMNTSLDVANSITEIMAALDRREDNLMWETISHGKRNEGRPLPELVGGTGLQ
jgi:hypothetical protein